MNKAAYFAIFPLVLAALLANRTIWVWTVFSADYFLGNPSSFRWYKDQLFEEEYAAYPVKGFIKPQSYPEINASDYSFATFLAATDNWRNPVILRGMFKDAPMMKWTPHNLAEFFKKQNNRTFLVVKKNDFTAKHRLNSHMSHLDADWMTLEQMIDNVTNGGSNYLQNSEMHFPEDTKLYNDIDLKRVNFDRETLLVQFFLGKKLPGEVRGSGSPLHCAAGPNLFVQLSSSKRWTMIHAKWSRYVIPKMFTYQVGSASIAAVTHQTHETHRWGNFPRYEGQINPGDAIWIPGWTWHEVQNVPSEDWALAIATRYSNYMQIWSANALFTWLVDFGVKDKPCLPGFRFFCAALHPGVTKGPKVQAESQASREASTEAINKKLRAGVLETDVE